MPGMIQPERELTWSQDGQRLLIVRVKSLFSGKWNTLDFVTIDLARSQWDAWQAGENIERAMPQLTAEEREFLITGATSEEWEAMFGEDD